MSAWSWNNALNRITVKLQMKCPVVLIFILVQKGIGVGWCCVCISSLDVVGQSANTFSLSRMAAYVLMHAFACLCGFCICYQKASLQINVSLLFYSPAIFERLEMKSLVWLHETSSLEESGQILLIIQLATYHLQWEQEVEDIGIGLQADICMPKQNFLNGTHIIYRSPIATESS